MYSLSNVLQGTNPPVVRPEFLGVLVWKETADTEVGLSVRKADDGSLRILEVNRGQGHLLQHATFEFADKLHCVNHQRCANLTAQEAMDLVRDATGWLTIVVQNCGGSPQLLSATVCNPRHEYARAGLSLQRRVKAPHPRQEEHMSLYISELLSFGLFASTSLLQVGDEVISINAIDCQRARLDRNAALLQIEHHFATDNFCTLVVVRGLSVPSLPTPLTEHLIQPAWMEAILAAVTDGDSDDIKTRQPVGISFNHDLKVSDIDPCGLLARGPFHFGDRLVCINKKACRDMSVEQVTTLLQQEAEKDAALSIVMQHAGGARDTRIVATKVYKPQQRLNINTTEEISLERTDTRGSLRISRLNNDSGLFAATALLAMWDEVLYFDTVDCAGLDARVITRAIQEEPDSVFLVARKNRLQWNGPHLSNGPVSGESAQQQQPQFESPKMVTLEDRPEFLEVVVWKDQPDIMVGLKMKKMGHDNALCVSYVDPNGLLGVSPLRSGDKLHHINNESSDGMTTIEAAELLRSTTGRLAIVVQNIGGNPELISTTVSRQPEAWRSKEVGVSLLQHREGPLCIHGLHQSGLFAETFLRVGDHVRLINDFDCCREGIDCRSAIRMMNEDTEFVTIVAARKQVAVLNPQARPEFMDSILWKDTADVKVGVSFAMDDDGHALRISSLDPCGLLSDSPFCVGDKLLRINNQSCQYMTEEQAAALVREATGTLSLVVHNESGDSSLVTSMVQKPTAESSPGISLESSDSDKMLCISGFYAYGLFGQSLLNVGDRVLSINNMECANLDVETAMNRSDFAHARSLTIAVKKHQGPVHVEVDPILDMLDDVSYVGTVVAEVEKQEPDAAQENGAYAQITGAVVTPERHYTTASYAMMAPTVQAVPTVSMISDDATVFALDGTRMDTYQNTSTQKKEESYLDRPEFLSVTMWKDEADLFALGIWVTEAEDETLRISALDPSGPFGKSQFQFSDKIHSIQNQSCEGMTAQEAIDILEHTTGWLNIVVHNADGDLSTVAVMVTKRTPDELAGISLKRNGDSVEICGLTPSGLLAHSLLNIGDKILFINGIDCRRGSAVELAIKTIREAPSCISIVAKAQYGTGIVLSVEDDSNPAEHETDDIDPNHETDPEQIEGDGNRLTAALVDPASANQGCCTIL